MAPYQQTLRDRQVGRPSLDSVVTTSLIEYSPASIEKILNLNQAASDASAPHHDISNANGLVPQPAPILNSDGNPIWKVLVFDDFGRDVISSVLRVNDLRGWGVTIHL